MNPASINFQTPIRQAPAPAAPTVDVPLAIGNFTVMGKDGHEYEFDYMKDVAYITKYKKYATWLFVVAGIALVAVIIYDWFKDTMRTFSGYRDIWSGKGSSGAAKVMGFTKGNLKRTGVMVVLFVVMWIMLRMIESGKKEIALKDIPRDVMEAAGADFLGKMNRLKKE